MSSELIPLDWEALETAVERNSPDIESYLELRSGQILTIERGDPESAKLRSRIQAAPSEHLRVESASSREQYRWMENFVESVTDPALRSRLAISIDGKGAFRRFKDVLLAFPAERERWFAYRCNLLQWHIQNWIAGHQLNVGTPPWGHHSEPEELTPVEPMENLPSVTPGEALRRNARMLIDHIEPMDLPSAIAFLEFLRARGSEALVTEEEERPPRPKIVRS